MGGQSSKLVSMKYIFVFRTISTKLTDYVLLIYCNILLTLVKSDDYTYLIAAIGTIICKLIFVVALLFFELCQSNSHFILIYCYILCKFGQHRVTLSFSWHRINQTQNKILYEKLSCF